MNYAKEYEREAEKISSEKKLARLIELVEGDSKKLRTALNYAISAKLSEDEQMELLLGIIKEKEEILDATLNYLKKA